MRIPPSVPENFVRTTIALRGAAGADWLNRLPKIISRCEERWALKVDPPFPEPSYNWAAPALRADGTGLEARPFGVGEVGLVCFSHARYPTEPSHQNPFSDSFSMVDGATAIGRSISMAQGLNYIKGLFKEALLYYDDEALYFEVRGKDNGVVRFSFEMLDTLKEIVEEQEEHGNSSE